MTKDGLSSRFTLTFFVTNILLAIVIESFTAVRGSTQSHQWLDDGLLHRYHRIVTTILPPSTANWLLGTSATTTSATGGGAKEEEGGGGCMIVESKPIKGTCRRGLNQQEDEDLAKELSSSIKNQAENLMIVDLLRNDLSRVCHPGSVVTPTLMGIESYATVHQMVSTIRGQLQPQYDAIDAFVACFPGGSMTGAPKVRTMGLIHEVEDGRPRGV